MSSGLLSLEEIKEEKDEREKEEQLALSLVTLDTPVPEDPDPRKNYLEAIRCFLKASRSSNDES